MDFDTIFNEGLNEILCIMRDLASYTAAKLKQEEFKIARYKIDYILFMFQEYLKGLPAPNVPLSSRSRILIYNTRHIMEGISVVFNVKINYIQRLYSNYLKYKERQLAPKPDNRADVMKPKRKTGKTRNFVRASNVIEIHDSDIPTTRDVPHDSAFLDVDMDPPVSLSAFVDGAEDFERDSQLLSTLGDAGIISDQAREDNFVICVDIFANRCLLLIFILLG